MEFKGMTNEQIKRRRAEIERCRTELGQELQEIEAEQLSRRTDAINAAIDTAIASVQEVDPDFRIDHLADECAKRAGSFPNLFAFELPDTSPEVREP